MKKTFTGPDAITYTYGYDDNNQLAVVQIPGVGLISYDEYSWNRPVGMTYPGGTTKEFTYDPLMRVESITVKDPTQTVLMDYHYTYDKADNVIGKSTEHGDYIYGYDDLYRLTIVDNPVLDDEAFTYDGVGNRITSADVPGDWTYNQNNELESYNGLSFAYDDNGNTIQKNGNGVVTNYVYNTENRLSRVEDGGSSAIAEYYYDPFGRRLWKNAGGTKTCYLYSDEGLVGEYNATGAEIKTYGYRPNSTWTTDPLFMKQGTEYYFYHNDHLGTPQKITDINGNVVWSAKYKSFGEASIEVETVVNNLRLPGQYYDSETNLHYNYHRYYDPPTGRYLSADPIGTLRESGYPFAYSLSNPTMFIDVEGLECKRVSNWERVPEYIDPDNPNNRGRLVLSNVISNWKKIDEGNALPLVSRGEAAQIVCWCRWKLQGREIINTYEKNATHKALFKCTCDLDECDKREWQETRYKNLPVFYSTREPIESPGSQGITRVTYGAYGEGGCSCGPPTGMREITI